MRTGDTVRDGQGNAYQVGQLLGRGLWGKSFLARRETTDQLFVLKVPLGPEDMKGDGGAPESIFAASRDALMEEARLYEQGRLPFLPRIEARFTAPDGQPAMLLPRLADSLERRIQDGLGVGPLIDVLVRVCTHVRALAASGATGAPLHGGLRPNNILFTESGEIVLTDVATPAVRRNIGTFSSMIPGGNPWLPPEVSGSSTEPGWSSEVDTWSLAMILWRGIVGPETPIAFPARGLDKAAVGAVKDKLAANMKQEDSNPRFTGRLAERVGVLLTRALSLETAPSPPYRFTRLDEFATRLEEIAALIRPHVTNIGKVLHDRPAAKSWFDTEETVSFSVTVGASAGVDGREEIGVGIAVYDLATNTKISNLDLGYTADKHPSGRYRFAFRITGLVPGHYKTRVAFAVRDSGQPPATAETEFEVRAAPGWVPPAESPATSAALPFVRENTSVTHPHIEPEASAPAPLPVSPPSPTQPAAHAVAPVAPSAPLPRPLTRAAPSPVVDLHPGRAAPVDPFPVSVPPPPPEPAPLPPRRPMPLLPASADRVVESAPAPRVGTPIVPAPMASPLPPSPAAMGGPGTSDEPAFEAPKNWTYEPIPRNKDAAAPRHEDPPSTVDLEPDDDSEPGPFQRGLAAIKNDPFVLVMTSLGGLIALLLLVYLAIRS